MRREGRRRMSKMERGEGRGAWDHGPEGFRRPVPASPEEGLPSWTIAPNFLKSTPGILKNEEGKGVKSHPIVRVLGMVLILSALVSLASWGAPPTTLRACASTLQPPHPLDVELPSSSQNAVGHALPQQYVAHASISINKNADFTALGFPGEGSPSNPYVIEGLNITANKTLIYIEETTAHFSIRNNLLNSLTGGDFNRGIFLKHVTHGTIDSNIVTNCWDGIELYHSEQITVAHNTVSQCEWAGITFCKSGKSTLAYNTISNCNGQGINLLISEQNIISHNTISVCGVGITLNSEDSFLEDFGPGQNTVAHNTVVECEAGITLAYSDQNIISNNTVSNCRKGIYLIDTKQNTLVGNQLVNNYLVVELYLLHRGYGKELYIWPVEHYLQATVAENVVNGRPLAFWQNECGGTIPPGAGQIFLLNSTGVEVTGQALARVPTGVFAAFCSHVTIHHNTVSECDEDGIALYKSVHSTVAHNSISQCGTGIKLDTSDQNTLDNNTVSQCEDGIVLTSTSGQNTLARNQLVNNSNNSLVLCYLEYVG